MPRAEAGERERTPEDITIGYTVCTSLVYDREIARVCAHDGSNGRHLSEVKCAPKLTGRALKTNGAYLPRRPWRL